MKWSLVVTGLLVCLPTVWSASPFDWTKRDNWDLFNKKFSAIDTDNCLSKTEDDMLFPEDTVSMKPKSNELLDTSTRVFRNRTCLLALHDIALSRSYFFSFLHRYLNKTVDFYDQPGWMYYYWRQASFVFGYPNCVNASSVYYDYNINYPNWMQKVELNSTIALFGPHVYRQDNTYYTWMREPDLNSAIAKDYGTGVNRNYTSPNYAPHPWYTKWLPDLTTGSDKSKGSFSVGLKFAHKIPGRYETSVFQGFNFFGPPLTKINDDVNLPVKFTQPYFDCHGKGEWLVSAVAPIVDHVPRYRDWQTQVEFGETPPRIVAVASVSTDWNRVDINPCPDGVGNPESAFSGVARCKQATTMCQPLTGWGFARGSYECVCRPGYRLPKEQNGPFQGADIELATEEEYRDGFDCIKVGYMHVVPSVLGSGNKNANNGLTRVTNSSNEGRRRKRNLDLVLKDEEKLEMNEKKIDVKRSTSESAETTSVDIESEIKAAIREDSEKHVKRSVTARYKSNFVNPKHDDRVLRDVFGPDWEKRYNAHKRKKREASNTRLKAGVVDEAAIQRMEGIFKHIQTVSQAADCSKLPNTDLHLPGDAGYGANEQFEYQGRTALSMAHFLSGLYQSNKYPMTQSVAIDDRSPNRIQLHAEVLSMVMSDHKVLGMGIFFDEDMYFEMLGKSKQKLPRQLFAPYAFQQNGEYKTVDLAGDPNVGYYLRQDWFRKAKMRWTTNTDRLTMYELRPYIRSNVNGTLKSTETLIFPVEYKTATYEDGQWTSPYFLCDGYINDWVMSYVVPFFDKTDYNELRFMGVVKVDVKLSYLDINQCSMPFYVPNAFKDTARCDYVSTYCVPVEGKRMERGAYRCECKQGYEYPFIENAWFYDGQQLEKEYEKQVKGEVSKFEYMKCRTAGALGLSATWILTGLSLVVFTFLSR